MAEWRRQPVFREAPRPARARARLLYRVSSRERHSDEAFPAELSQVRLNGRIDGPDGVIPLGSVGTVVHRYAGGEAFEVEFTHPVQCVATLRRAEVEPI